MKSLRLIFVFGVLTTIMWATPRAVVGEVFTETW